MAMGPFCVMTSGKVTNSLGQAWWPDNAGMCETCGNAWARAPQLSVTHLEDFYFFMDCTGHEIIISSGPHPDPRIVETALSSMQTRPWTPPLAQGRWPLERLDFPRPPNPLSKLRCPSCRRGVRNMWGNIGDIAAGGSDSSRRLLFFHGLYRP